VGSAFNHLQFIVSSGSSSKLTSNCSIQTKSDAKFEATAHLLLTASWLLSAANVLDEYVKAISSDESSRSKVPANEEIYCAHDYVCRQLCYGNQQKPCTHSLSELCPP
jgi:hypothetical protein